MHQLEEQSGGTKLGPCMAFQGHILLLPILFLFQKYLVSSLWSAYISGSQQRWGAVICPPEHAWQYLETNLVVITGGGGGYY